MQDEQTHSTSTDMPRRRFVQKTLASVSALGLLPGMSVQAQAPAPQPGPVVETQWGRVRGLQTPQGLAYLGVRYGADTGGTQRFLPPQDPQPWQGVEDAQRFGDSAPQRNPNPSGPPPIITAHLPASNPPPPFPSPLGESEDCLFLNVWTASLSPSRPRPVMLWLHGGFFRAGSGSSVDGSSLAARGDVVVVSINHRLNAFGFTHLAGQGEEAFAESGNAGMLDILKALQWVQDNIGRFGGDPQRVMVFGESGGGMKTTLLASSPQSDGLMHRAGIVSGPIRQIMRPDDAAQVSERLFHALALAPGDIPALQAQSQERLLTAFHQVSAEFPASHYTHLSCFSPVLSKTLFPSQPLEGEGLQGLARLPMLMGWSREEMAFFLGNDQEAFSLDEERLAERLDGLFPGKAEGLNALYDEMYPYASPSQRFLRAYSDDAIMLPTYEQAFAHASQAASLTYLYRFDWPSPAMSGALGAFHTLIEPFLFDTTEDAPATVGESEEARHLAQRLSNALVGFALEGRPGDSEWPPFSLESPRVRIFDSHDGIGHFPHEQAYHHLKG